MSALSDRIAEVVRHSLDGSPQERDEHAAHVAERIEAELGLTEERRNFSHKHQDRRWVSAWSEVKS